MKKRFTEEQIIGFLQEADAGVSVKELGRMGFPRFLGHYLKPSLACSNWSGLI